MALLHIFKFNKPVKDLVLEQGKEYIVGRGENCDLVLEAERGVSRQHLKIYQVGSDWTVEVLSRFGELYQGQNKAQKVVLTSGGRFEVPPYEFRFEAEPEVKEKVEISEPAVKSLEISTSASVDFSDKTFVGQLDVTPYLTVSDQNGEIAQIFRLEGQQWVAGRDATCSVALDNPKFSRRHFEIREHEGNYLIKDLGSSNGTLLNGQPVDTKVEATLRSGDVISVVDWSLRFELRDGGFESRLQEVPQEIRSPVLYSASESEMRGPASGQVRDPSGFQTQNQYSGTVYNDETPEFVPPKKFNFVRLLIGLILVGGGAYYFLDGEKNPESPTPQVKALTPFDKLSAQQQEYVKVSYRLADRLFKEGRYEMSRQEISKVHQLLPSYEESRSLEKLADVAIQTQIEQQKADFREREKIEMEEKVQKTVAVCRSKVNAMIEMKTIDDCLSPVIALNPDHIAIVELKSKVDQIISDRTISGERKAEYKALVRKHKALYEKANKMVKGGQELEAVKAFQVVINSRLPDPEDLKGQAKRQISSIQQKLLGQQSEFERIADEAQRKGELKKAVQTLSKALLVNPENEVVKGRINSMLTELKKQMQVYYQEGILEESVGEVETAKIKWKKIIELSLPEEDYYRKAKSKLKKYGVE